MVAETCLIAQRTCLGSCAGSDVRGRVRPAARPFHCARDRSPVTLAGCGARALLGPARRMTFAAILGALFLATAPVAAQPRDTWTQPNAGVRYLRREAPGPVTLYATVVDLGVEGVRIESTDYDARWQSVSEFAAGGEYAIAINGGFWDTFAQARGVTAGHGRRWPSGTDDEEVGFFAITSAHRAWISPPEQVVESVPAARLSEAVSGRPMLVRAGRLDQASLDEHPGTHQRHPRTAVGVSRDGRTVILIVVDGRQPHSRGMSLIDLANTFIELGAHQALNLDGGGSSAMFVREAGGIVNAPSGGRWEARLGLGAEEEEVPPRTKVRQFRDGSSEIYVRGIEREVLNHLGVIAPPADATPVERADEATPAQASVPESPRVIIEQPRAPPIRLGRSRELVYPAMYVGAATLVVAIAALFFFRRWRRLRAARAALSAARVGSS
jgi:hypothetical protein